jgi:hypothetical protein
MVQREGITPVVSGSGARPLDEFALCPGPGSRSRSSGADSNRSGLRTDTRIWRITWVIDEWGKAA